MEPRPQHRRGEGGQLGFDRRPERVGEPLGRLHHHVDQEAATVEPQLSALLVEIGDGLGDLGAGVLPHAGPVVEDAVDGRLAQPRLLGDLADLVPVWHVDLPPSSSRADANAPDSHAREGIMRLLAPKWCEVFLIGFWC